MRILVRSLIILAILSLIGCGGGGRSYDKGGGSEGDRSLIIPVAGQVTNEQTGEVEKGLPVFSSEGDDINSDLVYTDDEGRFRLIAKTDQQRTLTLNFDMASFQLEEVPEDTAEIDVNVDYSDEGPQGRATPRDINVKLKSDKDKKESKKKPRAPTEEEIDAALDANNSSSSSSSNQGNGRNPTEEDQELNEIVDEIDLL